MRITDDCMSCGICIEYCPNGAIDYDVVGTGYSQMKINQDVCTGCGACLGADCPADAIKES